ncbi:unnamed protein product [Clonostachys rhizophaga]|uniref:Rhodopsin domain-containing protein n=1 Tax=Clonostachys rhizophaga TaxID=160324 RepID=A0A9N9VEN5_9HYPO|nr:unnamed protein product [Clonostachys rhizophaga]
MSAPKPVTQYSGKPGLAPPDGQVPQFDNPPNRDTEAMVGIIICILLTSFCVITRGTYLVSTRQRLTIGDFLSFASVTLFFAYIGILFWFREACGFYVHQWDKHLEDLPLVLYIVHNDSVIYEATMASIKIAILLEWLRIFVPTGTRGWFWRISWSLLALVSMYYIGAILTLVFSCIPHEKIWYTTMPGRCSDTSVIFITSASMNLVSDVVMLILPQKKIWGLKLTSKRKFHISLAFSIGLVACACAAVRLQAGYHLYHSEDRTYSISPIALMCMAEMTCGYLIFSLPCAPKVYGPKGWIGKFVVRAGLMTSGGSSSQGLSQSSHWRSKNPNSSMNGYYQVDDTVQLQAMPASRSNLHDKMNPEEGIIRTTRIEATNEPRIYGTGINNDPRW